MQRSSGLYAALLATLVMCNCTEVSMLTCVQPHDMAEPVSSLLHGDFDEQAGRQSFMDAVNEWRGSGQPQATAASSDSNPVDAARNNHATDRNARSAQSKQPTMQHVSQPAPCNTSVAARAGASDATDAAGMSATLMQGQFDEADSHKSFLEALNEWRNAGQAKQEAAGGAATSHQFASV